MSGLTSLAYLVGGIFMALTVASSLRAAWRAREPHQLDIAFGLTTLFLAGWLRANSLPAQVLRAALLFAQPYILLRLVSYFRNVPRVLRGLAAAVTVASIGLLVIRPST